jgi:hypothetical protein
VSTDLAPETARDIVTLAMKEAGILGVGQTLLAEDVNDGFTYLQRMMKQWQRKRWLVNANQQIQAQGNNAISNTVGPGGYFNVDPRPNQIKGGYFYQLNTGQTPISLPLSPVFSYEDYVRITVKQLNTQPEYFFYDNQNNNGLGNVYIWPIPSPDYQIILLAQVGLGWPASLDSVCTLPDEYIEAIHYNLALRLCSAYGRAPQQSTVMLAKDSRDTVRTANVQIPELLMPSGLRNGKAFSLWNPDGY